MNCEKERKFVIITIISRQGFYNLDFLHVQKEVMVGLLCWGAYLF